MKCVRYKIKRLADYSKSASLFLISLFYNLTAIPIITLGNEKSIHFFEKIKYFSLKSIYIYILTIKVFFVKFSFLIYKRANMVKTWSK
ncbi:hypothetical protein CPZ25_004420 [Eubacterium maltosivorans]|uniref:Uncharacterized protein n=1 Tax=Eubacterium maltosivorans TaxID=2041044 RepID=A0A4P9C597_EUBML|nr:hypothetical protein CPZ25_004420 [Eubacterium maltosivorans]